MAKNPRLRFFVRYDKEGNPIPSSGVWRTKPPARTSGYWKELAPSLCCTTTSTTTTTTTT